MSLQKKAVVGALWTIGTGIGSRLFSVVAVVVITRFLAPEVVGEVGVATALVFTASELCTVGFGQYIVAKPEATRSTTFHVTVYNVIGTLIAAGGIVALGEALAPAFAQDDPAKVIEYIPGMALVMVLSRGALVPSRILLRNMRFRVAALIQGLSEIIYAVSSVALAAAGWGGYAIIVGNLCQHGFRMVVFALAVDWREWLEPHKLTRSQTRDIFRFGGPMLAAASAGRASKTWDNLVVARMFGTGPMGLYEKAYNLADIPAEHIGESIGDVLLPSFARLEPARRADALVRGTQMLSLVVFPIAVGLGAVSETLVAGLFNEEWQGLAPLLLILSAMSVVRPVGWTITSYLQACDRTRPIMAIEITRVFVLLSAIVAMGQIGLLWACVGVGVAFTLMSLFALLVVRHYDKIPLSRFLATMVGPLAACAVMTGAVFGARYGLGAVGLDQMVVLLGCEIAAGAVAYVAAAFVLAPRASREFVRLVREALRGRRDG